MQPDTTAPPPRRTGGLLTLIGGIVVLVSSFIDWGHPRATGSGVDVTIKVRGGSLALIVGVLAILFGLVLMFVRGRGLRLTAAILSLLLGAGMIVIALTFVAGDSGFRSAWASGCVDNNICTGITKDALKKSLDRQVTAGNVKFDPGKQIGLYLALGGGVVVLIGGILGLRRGKAAAPAAPTAWQQPGYAPAGEMPPAAPPPSGIPPAAAPPPGGVPPAAPPPGSAPPAAPPPATPPPASPPPASPPPASPPPASPPASPPAAPPPAGDGGSFSG
jgi:hypothetical protein